MYGELHPTSSEDYFDGKFHIPGIKLHTFWSSSDPSVSIAKHEKLYACADCGFLWGFLQKRELKKVLEKVNWQGEEQFEQPPRKNIAWYVSTAIISGFLLLIIYLHLDYRYFS